MGRSRQWARVGLDGGPHPVDVHVGNRVRMRRTLGGMTQATLANALGVASQQILKYEKGINRVSASQLKEIADILGVPISYFFNGLGSDAKPNADDKLEQ